MNNQSNEITDEETDWLLKELLLSLNGDSVDGQSLYEIAEKLINHYEQTKDMQHIG